MEARVLIADDEREIRDLVSMYLATEGIKVTVAEDGDEALRMGRDFDLYIFDVMMPGKDGYQLCRTLREETEAPIILLTAKDEEHDKILGLGIGADDYITKPFSPLELVARVKAHLRRYRRLRGIGHKEIMTFGTLEIDTGGCRVLDKGQEIELTGKEYGILEYLATNAGKVLTRSQIFEAVWDDPFVEDDNTVMVHLRHLRQKLEEDPSKPQYIKTIRGLGYRFEGGSND